MAIRRVASAFAFGKSLIKMVTGWLKRRPPKMKAFLSSIAVMLIVLFLTVIHFNLFIASEICHYLGISILIYKLVKERTCAGLSLKSQELTALFLAVRLYCSFVMELNLHTFIDSATLLNTLWVIYMIRFRLKSTYMIDQDDFSHVYMIAPCAILPFIFHPRTDHYFLYEYLWAFCVYMESISVLPQLRLIQNMMFVEPITAHYVFALGIARLFNCTQWALQLLGTHGGLLTFMAYDEPWPAMVLISEIVQTFILADFCYYYIKSILGGQVTLRLPSGVV
ncbi:putative ER lumen protein retaining receptor [Zostera marina]|uniref:Putative ER lumen protein retaining receptor n=1 Tax=Zostera marina TaxID=29655 RepID=A0A0K9PBF6_ZOSMR|nr:putative ER lumen protein retaining receptor [Zostera marina]